jgi:hypothetical protein
VSAYQVNKLCFRATHEPSFLERLKADAEGSLSDFELTVEERQALLTGDVARLFQLGAHPYLLGHLTGPGLFGLTRELYQQRMRALLPRQ